MWISVVCLRNWLEAFLASCIPNLQFDLFLVNLNSFYFEVYPNRAQVWFCKLVFNETKQKRCFTTGAGPDKNNFKQLVLLWVCSLFLYFSLGLLFTVISWAVMESAGSTWDRNCSLLQTPTANVWELLLCMNKSTLTERGVTLHIVNDLIFLLIFIFCCYA